MMEGLIAMMNLTKKPAPTELTNLNPSDLNFLISTENVEKVDGLQAIATALKQVKDIALWGPQAKLLAMVLRKAWKDTGGDDLVAEIINAFDLSGDVSVDPDRVNDILNLIREQGKHTFTASRAKIQEIIGLTIKTADKRIKKETKKIEEEWALVYTKVAEEAIEAFLEEYSEVALIKEVERLSKITLQNVSTRNVDKKILVERIKKIKEHPRNYLDTLADVEAGRVYNHTTLQYGMENGYSTYQIIAQIDKVTCKVCLHLDGRIFSVQKAIKKVEKYMTLGGNTEKIKKLFPFPREPELDNKSPEEIQKLDLSPPFHGRCRCSMNLIA